MICVMQEENHRLQNKVLAVSSEGARISDLEDANRKLTQVHTIGRLLACSSLTATVQCWSNLHTTSDLW